MKGKRAGKSIFTLLMITASVILVSCGGSSAGKGRKGEPGQVVIGGVSIPAEKEIDDPLPYTIKPESIQFDEEEQEYYVNDIIIVYFKEGTDGSEVKEAVESVNGTIAGGMPVLDKYEIRVPASSLSELQSICEKLESMDSVDLALTDFVFSAEELRVPNDPWKKGEVWDEEEPDGSNWWLEAISAPGAWEYNDYFSKIKIGIVDSGFDAEHEDLKDVITSVSPNNEAGRKHGTHVAGIIGAKADNGKGIAGIVWNCELDTVDYFHTDDQKKADENNWICYDHILHGVEYLITEKGSKIINLSVGFAKIHSKEAKKDHAVADKSARIVTRSMDRLLAKGYDFLIVQGAGNGNKFLISIDAYLNGLYSSVTMDNCYVGDTDRRQEILDRIIVVGSAKQGTFRPYVQPFYSNAGKHVTICAPGNGIYSTAPDNKYDYDTGTSMAAPVVTGVAGLVWSADPSLTGADVKRIVCDPKNTKYTVQNGMMQSSDDDYPMVNAELAVKAALGPVISEELTPEVTAFFDDFISQAYYSESFLFQYGKTSSADYFSIMPAVIMPLHASLHKKDPARYPYEEIRTSEDIKDVLDVLYGKDRVSVESFFGLDHPITAEDLSFLLAGTDYFPTGWCKYQIHDVKTDGDDIVVTYSCALIDMEYGDSEIEGWWMGTPLFGTYEVYDMIAGTLVEKDEDPALKDHEDYAEYAGNYQLSAQAFKTKTIRLFQDADGIHIR